MAVDSLEICNLALARVGVAAGISALGDGTKEGNLCNALYAPMRDATLEERPWRFARKRYILAAAAGGDAVPRTGWAYIYALPSEVLIPLYIVQATRTARGKIPFVVESKNDLSGKVLLADLGPASSTVLELAATAKLTSVPAFSALFVDALAWRIAHDLVMPLSLDKAYLDLADRGFEKAMAKARAVDDGQGQEDPITDFQSLAEVARGARR